MARLISALWLMSNLAAGTGWAQSLPPNATGVAMGHWHLNSRDVAVNKTIFLAMGGTEIAGVNGIEIVGFPGVRVNLNLRRGTPPPAGDNSGAVVNQVGLTVRNVQDSIAKWKAAGVPVEPGAGGRADQAWVTTPDGFRVEIRENKDQNVPILSDHVHFAVPASATAEIQAWYQKIFGARPGTLGPNQVADIPGAHLIFSKANAPTITTKGRVLDHFGFDIKNLEDFCKTLEAAGIKFDRPYAKNETTTGIPLAFIYDPWGTYIELNEYRADRAAR